MFLMQFFTRCEPANSHHHTKMIKSTVYILLGTVFFLLYPLHASAQCRYTFATSITTPGNTRLGEADILCQQRAAASTVPEIVANSASFVAWLSNDTHDAAFRIGGFSNECFQNANGIQVASSTAELVSGTLQASQWAFNELLEANTSPVWTHTLPSGQSSVFNCDSQTQVLPQRGVIGADSSTFSWVLSNVYHCSSNVRLGCIQTPTPPAPTAAGYAYPIVEPCDALAFVSGTKLSASSLGDTAAMDETCQREARLTEHDYGKDWQHWRAVYSTSTRTAADMLSNTLCVGSLIGRPYWKRDTTAEPFTFVQAPSFTADAGIVMTAFAYVWTGTSVDLNTPMTTCSDWTSASGNGRALTFLGADKDVACSSAQHLLCVRATNDFTGPTVASLVAGARLMFTTRQEYAGGVSSLLAADTYCQLAAAFSDLPFVSSRAAKFIAYVSTEDMDALARLYDLDANIDKPYVNTIGGTVFTGHDAIADIGPPEATLFRDENGLGFFPRLSATNTRYVMSGTSPGGRATGDDCMSWTTSAASVTYGYAEEWLLSQRSSCGQPRSFYCIEVEEAPTNAHYQSVIKLETPAPCLYMFRTSAKISLDFGTLNNVDELCVSLASSSTIPAVAANAQHFMGLVSNTTLSFRTRFLERHNGLNCWKNTKETLLVSPTGAGLLDGQKFLLSTYWFDENGAGASSSYIYTGSYSDGTSYLSYTCNDWTTLNGAFGAVSSGWQIAYNTMGVGCGSQSYMACVQVDMVPAPTANPTKAPTRAPTQLPTRLPTKVPTALPTRLPTKAPTRLPTKTPSSSPSEAPTKAPTDAPLRSPSKTPTKEPTRAPNTIPTASPTPSPTDAPTTKEPTLAPSTAPSRAPTRVPSSQPSSAPTSEPLVGQTGSAVLPTTTSSLATGDTSVTVSASATQTSAAPPPTTGPPPASTSTLSMISSGSGETTANILLDTSSSVEDGGDSLIPMSAGIGGGVLCLLCCLLLLFMLRRRRSTEPGVERRRRGDSSTNSGKRSRSHSHTKSLASKRSRQVSRRSQRYSTKLHASLPFAAYDGTLPAVASNSDQYQSLPHGALSDTGASVAGGSSPYMAFSTVDSSPYQELRKRAPPPPPVVRSPVRSPRYENLSTVNGGDGASAVGSTPYGHIPAISSPPNHNYDAIEMGEMRPVSSYQNLLKK